MSVDMVRAAEERGRHSGHFDEMGIPLRRWTVRASWLFEFRLDPEPLKASLSRLLDYYPHLAGRFVDDGRIALDNQGVPFGLHERPSLTVDALREDHTPAYELGLDLSARKMLRGRAAPITVALTRLRNGTALTVTMSHDVMDGHTFYHLPHFWARVHTGKSIPEPVFREELPFGNHPPPIPEAEAEARRLGWTRISLWRMTRAVFKIYWRALKLRVGPVHFSDADVERLRHAAREESGRDDLTRTDVLAAHLSRLNASLFSHAPETAYTQGIMVSHRGRVEGISERYVGNASFPIPGAEHTADEPLGVVASRIHDALAPYLRRPSPTLTEEVVLHRYLHEQGSHWVHVTPSDYLARKPTSILLNNFTVFPIYDVDFGTEEEPIRPSFVVPHNGPGSVILWPSPPEREGFDMYFESSLAKAVGELDRDDLWWKELFRYHEGDPRPPA